MTATRSDRRPADRSQRPKATTVFAAAFLAGAAAAVGLNRTLDVHLAQRQPRVESEPIFVALRSLPQGTPLTVWDVALRDWPKAMLPAAALRPRDSFDGMVLKHSIREGQPILSIQLVKAATVGNGQLAAATTATTATTAATAPASVPAPQTDLWAPAEVPAEVTVRPESVSQSTPVADHSQRGSESTAVAAAAPAETTIPAPVIAEPVVVSASPSTDIDSAIAPGGKTAETTETGVATAGEPVIRYLVVPERIGLEADRSFVPPPAPEQPRAATAETVAQASPAQAATAPAQAGVNQGRGDRPTPRTSANRDRQSKQPVRSATGQAAPAKQAEKTPFLRSMIPSLSLGMGASEPSAQPAPRPEANSERVPRSTPRGFGPLR